jgi:hypothetical protein
VRSLDIRLNKPQLQAYNALGTGQIVVTPWGRGVGKSKLQRLVSYCLIGQWDGKRLPYRDGTGEAPRTGVRCVFLMDTLKHFTDVHWHHMLNELGGGDPEWDFSFLGATPNKTTHRIEFPGGSWIQPFPSAEHTAQAGRGIRCDFVAADECDDTPVATYNGVVQPWFTEPWSMALQLFGGTPRMGRNGLLFKMHEQALKGTPSFHTFPATYLDCPETVAPDRVETARATMPPSVFRREWECNFDSAEGLVYDMWSDKFHVRGLPENARLSNVVVGVDWGYTDPQVMLVVGIVGHGEDSQAYVLKEFCHAGKVPEEWVAIAQEIHARYPMAQWYADPSQPAQIETLRMRAGVSIVGADNKIDQGVASVADKLWIRGTLGEDGRDSRWARMYVDPSCENLRNEMVRYRREPLPGNPDKFGDTIRDKNNHCEDALRYLTIGHFGFPASVRTEWTGAWQ